MVDIENNSEGFLMYGMQCLNFDRWLESMRPSLCAPETCPHLTAYRAALTNVADRYFGNISTCEPSVCSKGCHHA